MCLSFGDVVGFKDVARNIDAVLFALQLCSSGVLTRSRGVNIDHGVLAVGNDTDAGSVHWKVQNPWELSGVGGFSRLFRGKAVSTDYEQVLMPALRQQPVSFIINAEVLPAVQLHCGALMVALSAEGCDHRLRPGPHVCFESAGRARSLKVAFE